MNKFVIYFTWKQPQYEIHNLFFSYKTYAIFSIKLIGLCIKYPERYVLKCFQLVGLMKPFFPLFFLCLLFSYSIISISYLGNKHLLNKVKVNKL